MSGDRGQFGARLRAARHSAGLSQQDLAERSGLAVRSISNLERGRTSWPHPDSVTPPGKKPTDVTPLLQIDDGRFCRRPSHQGQKLFTEGRRRVNAKASPQAHDRVFVAPFHGDLKIARLS